MKTVYPSALEFRQDKCIGKSSLFELTVEFGKTEESHIKLTLTASELLARKDTFQKSLLKLTKRHHQVLFCNFLCSYWLMLFASIVIGFTSVH